MDPLPVKTFTDKLRQCQNMPTDKDRVRLIKAVFDNYALEPKQAAQLANCCTHFGQVIECCTQLLEKTTNQDEFIDLALDLCKFPEDRVAMCAMLDIEFIPLPPKDQAKVKPRKLVSQYT